MWDGIIFTIAYTGQIESAGNRKLSIDSILYYMDENGIATQSAWLPTVPDTIIAVPKAKSRADIVYQDEVTILEDIPPLEAYNLGALYRHYTRIYVDNIELTGDRAWNMNEWQVISVIETASGHIIARDATTAWHNLTDDKVIKTAYPGGIMLYNMGAQHGYIADETGEYEVTWSANYFDNAYHQLADGVWYTENGYTWTADTGVISEANSMYCWNTYTTYPATYDAPYGEKPWIIPAGVREENGEQCTYWVECVTGKLYRHIPSIDNLSVITALYAGPYTRIGSEIYHNTLTPVIIENLLYYHANGNIYTYNFDTTVVAVFAGDQQLIPW
jgi:hypothetical protein